MKPEKRADVPHIFSSLFSPARSDIETKPNEIIDWSQLPDKFIQFVPLFEYYGKFQFESRIFEYLSTLSDEDRKAISSAYILLNPHDDELIEWSDIHNITKSPAAALVYFTSYFMDIAKSNVILL